MKPFWSTSVVWYIYVHTWTLIASCVLAHCTHSKRGNTLAYFDVHHGDYYPSEHISGNMFLTGNTTMMSDVSEQAPHGVSLGA